MLRRALMMAALGGCEPAQSSLAPRGPAAAEIEALWWWLLALTLVPALITIAGFLVAARRGRRRAEAQPDAGPPPRGERAAVLGLAIGPPTAILVVILVRSTMVGVRVDAVPAGAALIVEVIGHRYWWEVRYPDFGVITANELHIPAGRPVALRLTSQDVIHSFWVPSLHGKMDMIPGRVHAHWLQADAPGAFRGQCAEFCGVQHALMAFWVLALPAADFDAWLAARQREVAVGPEQGRGLEVFFEVGCDQCHAIRGLTPASSRPIGPDLTHLADRSTLAAGTLPNRPGHLYGWLLDPQAHKPGNAMPPTRLPSEDADALVSFLYSLR